MKVCGSNIVDEFSGADAFVWLQHFFFFVIVCLEMSTASLRALL